jgi:hypothetical protein
MSSLFTCPHCGTQTEVPPEYSGLSGPCGVCGKTITVPASPNNGLAPERGSAPRPVASPSGHSMSSVGLVLVSVAAIVAGAVLLLGLILSIAWPVADRLRSDSSKLATRENLMRIAAAMQAYEQEYGSFPPAFVRDSQDRPAHSWRVLLLPHLGREDLYRRYRFSEPWDSPQNLSLLHEMPEVYACAADEDALLMGETSFMVVVGDVTLFPGSQPIGPRDITDGAYATLLVVQTESCGIAWTDPQDLDFERMSFQINGPGGQAISSFLEGGAFVATADGQVAFLPDETPPDVVRGAATRNGREVSDLHAYSE